tara:strand:- start:376 stop:717 length:342 start_codon:yes stop_codon:yes gene_type:complete
MKSDPYNRGYEFCAKSSAISSNIAKSSAKSSYINTTIIKNLAKLTNINYKAAINRNQRNPFDELERRVIFKLRPNYSFESFKEIQLALMRMPLLEKVLWLRNTEDALNAKRDS